MPPSKPCTRRLQSDIIKKQVQPPFKGLHLFFIYSAVALLLPEMAGISSPIYVMALIAHICPADDLIWKYPPRTGPD